MPDGDAWEVVNDALECKTPSRIPKMCLGADFEFMYRLAHSPLKFSYEEFSSMHKMGLPWIPFYVPVSVKLGVDLCWNQTPVSKLVWLEESRDLGIMTAGRYAITTRNSSFEPPEGVEKRPIPYFWHNESCFSSKTSKKLIRELMEKQPKVSNLVFKNFRKVKENCEKHFNLITAGSVIGMWESLSLGFGFGVVAKAWRKDREFCYEMRDFFSELGITGMKKLIKYGKPRVVMCGDDAGMNSGLLMGINLWRELVKPTLAEYVKIAHDAGVKFLLHSCGRVEELFKDLVEIGVDGVESLKPTTNDLVSLKKKFGDKIALLGTLDETHVLKNSSPSEIKKYTTSMIKKLGPHGYIPGPTNTFVDHPVENAVAVYEAIDEYKI
ncbi:MAG: uroporphyrinogen decarboxylase family protein [Candidatus Hodarchaeota archaeon]